MINVQDMGISLSQVQGKAAYYKTIQSKGKPSLDPTHIIGGALPHQDSLTLFYFRRL